MTDYEKRIFGVEQEGLAGIYSQYGPEPFPESFVNNIRGKVLDLGCGAGDLTSQLKRRLKKNKIYGVDLSSSAIGIANNNYKNIKFSVSKAEKLPFKDNFFDGVMSYQVIEHLGNPSEIFKEVKRVLKPDGLFFLAVPVEGEKYVINPPSHLARKYQGHIQRFTKLKVLRLLENDDYTIQSCSYSGGYAAQIINTACLYLFSLFNKDADFSFQSFVQRKPSNKLSGLIKILRKTMYLVQNTEDLLLPGFIPGRSVHVVSINKKKI